MSSSSLLKGTGVALVTPLNADGTVDRDGLAALLDHVTKNGVDYLVINGTTGESATTSNEEKQQILDLTVSHNKGQLPILFGIGGNNTAEVIAKTKSFNLKGVDGILSVCPYYNKPTQEGLYRHYQAIADASPLPIVLYNVPSRTGVNMSAKTTIKLAGHSNIIGIKEANSDLTQAIEISNVAGDDFKLISGDDMLTVSMIAIGASGVISVLANAFPGQFSSMVKSALNNDFAKAAVSVRKFCAINPCLYEESNPVGIKQSLELMGICKRHVRLPLVEASEELRKKIQNCLSKF